MELSKIIITTGWLAVVALAALAWLTWMGLPDERPPGGGAGGAR